MDGVVNKEVAIIQRLENEKNEMTIDKLEEKRSNLQAFDIVGKVTGDENGLDNDERKLLLEAYSSLADNDSNDMPIKNVNYVTICEGVKQRVRTSLQKKQEAEKALKTKLAGRKKVARRESITEDLAQIMTRNKIVNKVRYLGK